MNGKINFVKTYPFNENYHLEANMRENSMKVKPNPIQKVNTNVENGSLRINILV